MRRLGLSIGFLGATCSILNAQAFDPAVTQQLDRAIRSSMALNVMPAVIVHIERPGGSWSKAYGYRDPLRLIAVTGRERTRIGSVTKTMTATIVLRLVDQGKVELDAPISRYLQGIRDGDKVTVRMCGNMTSGIPSYTESSSFVKALLANPQRVWLPNELLEYALALKPTFAPGTSWHYSNTNAVILGLLVEKVTGKPIAQVMKEMLFDPLGMKDTAFIEGDFPSPKLDGFTVQSASGAEVNATSYSASAEFSAGAVVSTGKDTVRWAKALGTGELLSSNSFQQRLKLVQTVPPVPPSGGYGFGIGNMGGWLGHDGEVPGYNTSCFYDLLRKIAISILVSSDVEVGNNAPASLLLKVLTPILRQ